MGRFSEFFNFSRKADFVLNLDPVPSEATFASETTPVSIDTYFRRLNELEGVSPSVGRRSALSIPPVLRGRNIICNIATLPLICFRGDSNERMRNLLLEQIDPTPAITNLVTLENTVEDLLFDSVSVWRIAGYSADTGYPVKAYHVRLDSITFQTPSEARPVSLPAGDAYHPDAEVYIDGVKADKSNLIIFYSPHPPFRKTVGAIIRRAIKTAQTSEVLSNNPMPKLLLTPSDALTDPFESNEEAKKHVQKFTDSLSDTPVHYIGAALKATPLEFLSPQELQLVEIEKSINLGIANALGLDPEDLGISTTSRTYQNAVDRRKDRINDLLNPYMQAISQRLSMGDVTPRGYRILFDQDDYLRADPKTRMEINTGYKNAGVITDDEIRLKEGWAPLTAAQRRQIAPAAAPEATGAPIRVQATVGDPQRQIGAQNSSQSFGFADDAVEAMNFSVDSNFAVDVEQRIIKGLAVPWNQESRVKGGNKYVFEPGSINYSTTTSSVKLLRDHNWPSIYGKLVSAEVTEAGLVTSFAVAPGPEGDNLLALAKHGTLDGMSIGLDPASMKTYIKASHPGVRFVSAAEPAELMEVSLVGNPAFINSRVSAVYNTDGGPMPCTRCGATDHAVEACTRPDPQAVFTPSPEMQQFIQAMFNNTVNQAKAPIAAAPPSVQQDINVEPRVVPAVDKPNEPVFVAEKSPYTFDSTSEFSFAKDIQAATTMRDGHAQKRLKDFLESEFAVTTTNAAALNPTIQRPDMYVDQLDYEYPIWNTINKGAPPNGVTQFQFPKWASSSGLVQDHTEGVEPTLGSFAVTNQSVTPTALDGKIEINREAWDQLGSPSLDNLVRAEMRRAWYEGLETAAAAFLDGLTLTGYETTITTAASDSALQQELIGALVDIVISRGGYRLRDFLVQVNLFKKLVLAKDGQGRLLFPPIGPQNAAGTLGSNFANLNINGLQGRPAWALGAASSAADNSYLLAREDVHGWATAPEFHKFDIQLKSIYIGIWGYKAFANSRTAGIRRFIYDPVA